MSSDAHLPLKPIARLAPAWPYALVTLATFVLFWDLIFAGRALFWGTPLLQFHPWREYAFDLLRSGHLPLWNPYLGMGAPLAANYQSAVFYPPNWLFLVVPVDRGLGWLAVAHVVFAGVGMIRLARRIGLGELGQAVAGSCFALSGYAVSRMGFITINNALAWLPWLVLAADRLAHERNSRSLLGLTLPLSMQLLAGHAQISWYSILVVTGWYAWRVLARPAETLRAKLTALAVAGAALALAFLLAFCAAAIQLLPTHELLSLSARASAEKYDFITNYSLWPWRLANLIAPDLFGNPAHGDYWGYGNYWEGAAYIGLLPLFFAILTLKAQIANFKLQNSNFKLQTSNSKLQTPKLPNSPTPQLPNSLTSQLPDSQTPNFPTPEFPYSHTPTPPNHPTTQPPNHPATLFLTLSLFTSLLLALGKFSPVFPFLYWHVPTFNLFQAPGRWMIVFVFGAALLAGIGAERWRKPEGWRLYVLRLGVAGGLAALLSAMLAALALAVRPSLFRAVAVAAAWAIASILLLLFIPRDRSRAWSMAVALLVVGDLVLAGWGLNPTVDASVYRAPSESALAVRAEVGDHRIHWSGEDEHAVKFGKYFLFDTFDTTSDWAGVRALLLPNTSLAERIASTNNFEPLLPERYEKWMAMLDAASPEHAARLLALMDARAAVVAGEPPPGADPIYSADGSTVARLNDSAARVRFITSARIVLDGDAALAAVAGPHFDPEREIVIEADEGYQAMARAVQGTAEGWEEGPSILSLELTPDPQVVRISASVARPGYLLLSDQYYPGWHATVDGRPIPILRADYLFRAVSLPPGDHLVEFVYRPISFRLGALLSGLAWAVIGVWVVGWLGGWVVGWSGGWVVGISSYATPNHLTTEPPNHRTPKPPHSIARRPILPALLTTGLLLAYLSVILAANRGDPLGFAVLGTRYASGDPAGTSGYDGQFAYFIALDPGTAPAHLDVPAYRFQRILHPLLARAFALGQADWIPWTLVGVGVVAHAAGTWLVATLLSTGGVSPWYALAYGLWAGFFLAVRLDLSEPLAYALVAGAFLAWSRGRAGCSAALFGLAAFAKETTLIFAAGQAVYLLVSKRWRELGWLIGALVPFAAFQAFLWVWLGSPGLASGGDLATPFEWIPYMGLWRIGYHGLPALALFSAMLGPTIVLPSAWGIGASAARLLKRDWHPYHWALAANAAVIPFLPFSTFREPVAIVRFACGLVLAVILFGASTRSPRVLRYAMFWSAMLILLSKE